MCKDLRYVSSPSSLLSWPYNVNSFKLQKCLHPDSIGYTYVHMRYTTYVSPYLSIYGVWCLRYQKPVHAGKCCLDIITLTACKRVFIYSRRISPSLAHLLAIH